MPLPRIYLLLGFFAGYALLMLFKPVRRSLDDGFRCLVRFKRIGHLCCSGFAYFVFQFATFTPIQSMADVDLSQITSFADGIGQDLWKSGGDRLPVLEGVAGIFDNATTTYPLSVIAALLLFLNWRGLHGVLFGALRKRYRFWSYLIYLILLLGALASLLKPIVFSRLPHWGGELVGPRMFQISASVDVVAFIFEYLLGVYVQVYLITVCLAWIKGLGFEEGELLRFAMRRFSHVLEWAGIDHCQHAGSSAPAITRLFYQHPRRARLSPGPTRFHEWINHRVLFGADFAGAAQRKSGRRLSRARGIHHKNAGSAGFF